MYVQRMRRTVVGWALLGTSGIAGLLACGADDRQVEESRPPFQGIGNLGGPGANDAPGTNNAPGATNPNTPAGAAGAGSTPVNGETPNVNGLAPAPGGNGSGNGAGAVPPAMGTPPVPPEQQQPPAPPANGMPAANASAGCGLSQGIPASTNVANTILTFPPTYDGSTPVPLLFAFHGAGRTNTDMRMVDSRTMGSQLENNYVLAFMKSAGNAWDVGTDYPRFQAAITQILAERCVDTSAIFAMGHSSGAQFIVGILGDGRARETRFAAVVPVSSSLLNNPNWDPLPTMLIHGERDTQRPNDLDGAQDITQYVRSNQCQMTTQPVAVPGCASLAGGVAVDAGCVQYDGCVSPTLFCRHDDPNYLDNGTPTNHGWPCFANNQIFSFLESSR